MQSAVLPLQSCQTRLDQFVFITTQPSRMMQNFEHEWNWCQRVGELKLPTPNTFRNTICNCGMLNLFVENQPNAAVPSQPSNPAVAQALPVYIPTPKHILEARKTNGTNSDGGGAVDNGAANESECSASKRPRLEYVPKAIKINHNLIPTYVPSALSRSTSTGSETNDMEYEPSNVAGQTTEIGGDITGLLTDLSADQVTKNGQTSANNAENGALTPIASASVSVSVSKESNEATETTAATTNDDTKSKENRHRSSSSSSSRHHRHHSSSNHKSSHSDRKSGSSSSRSSSSSHRSSRHHHHSSSRKSKHSDKDKDDDKVKLKADSKHSDGKSPSSESHHRSSKKSSSSSSSSSSRHHHRSSKHPTKNSHSNNNHSSSSNKRDEDCLNDSVVYDMDSEIDDDDDDVEAQCRMIFEEFKPQTANDNQQSDDMLSLELQATATNNHDSGIDDTTSAKLDDATKKKRIAHENADKQIKPIATFKRNADHVKNAMQVIHNVQQCSMKKYG